MRHPPIGIYGHGTCVIAPTQSRLVSVRSHAAHTHTHSHVIHTIAPIYKPILINTHPVHNPCVQK